MDYQNFIKNKVKLAEQFGFTVQDSEINQILKPHQRDMVRWMVKMGRAACFAAFGPGKSVIQLEAVRLTLERAGGNGLIVIPLGVRQNSSAMRPCLASRSSSFAASRKRQKPGFT